MSESPEETSVLVTGATGVVGRPLISLLAKSGFRVTAISRREPSTLSPEAGVKWVSADLSGSAPISLASTVNVLFHAAPLWLLPDNLWNLVRLGVARIVAFSSTSVLSKRNSSSARERELSRRLAQSEEACLTICANERVNVTLFRPTMIYGYGRDRNVMAIARFIRRFRFFPVAGPASGLRQPVHADDLVQACVRSMDVPATYGRTYELSGGETLSYRSMVERIFSGLEIEAHIVSVPVGLIRALLRLMDRLGISGTLTPEMADRMNENLCFDHEQAAADFGYSAAPFLINPKRDLARPD